MKFTSCIICFIFLYCSASKAFTEELVVGISTGYPPYYYNDKGKITGFCVELINSVAKEIDLRITYKQFPWKRLILKAQKGEIDAIMPLFKTDKRKEYLYFDGLELTYETNHFFTANDFKVVYDGSLENLSGYRIGVVADYSYGKKFDSFDFPQKVVSVNEKKLIHMFKEKRIDIGVGNRYVISHYAGQEGIAETIRFINPPISQERLYMGFTRKGEKYYLAEKFTEALRKYKATVEYQKLTSNYGILMW